VGTPTAVFRLSPFRPSHSPSCPPATLSHVVTEEQSYGAGPLSSQDLCAAPRALGVEAPARVAGKATQMSVRGLAEAVRELGRLLPAPLLAPTRGALPHAVFSPVDGMGRSLGVGMPTLPLQKVTEPPPPRLHNRAADCLAFYLSASGVGWSAGGSYATPAAVPGRPQGGELSFSGARVSGSLSGMMVNTEPVQAR
jgi:hypothetical protein